MSFRALCEIERSHGVTWQRHKRSFLKLRMTRLSGFAVHIKIMLQKKQFSVEIAGKTLTIEVSALAEQANAAVSQSMVRPLCSRPR